MFKKYSPFKTKLDVFLTLPIGKYCDIIDIYYFEEFIYDKGS